MKYVSWQANSPGDCPPKPGINVSLTVEDLTIILYFRHERISDFAHACAFAHAHVTSKSSPIGGPKSCLIVTGARIRHIKSHPIKLTCFNVSGYGT